jgi:predicted membrane protein
MNSDKTSIERARDTGLVFVLLLLLIIRAGKYNNLLPLAIGLLVLVMVWPAIFKVPARLWFGLSDLMGAVISKILLSLVFLLLLTPLAVARKLTGADLMKTKLWKKGQESVLVKRDHTFSAADLEKPY